MLEVIQNVFYVFLTIQSFAFLAGLITGRVWSANQTAPFGPGAIVIAHIVVAHQVFQHKPRVATALSNSAVRNHGAIRSDALFFVELAELIDRLERAVFIGSGTPGHINRALD